MTTWWTSPYTGLFRRFSPGDERPHDPAIAIVAGTAANRPLNRDESSVGSLAVGGAARVRGDAELAAVGEAIERWQTHELTLDDRLTASFDDWPLPHEAAIAPSRLVLFHPEQYAQPGFPFEPLTASTVCSWTRFRRAGSGAPVWLPSETAYLDLRPTSPTPRFAPMISTGLSTGPDPATALLRGVQEVIERDAVVGAWWRSYRLSEIHSERAFELVGPGLSSAVRRPNLSYRFYRLNSPFARNVALVSLAGEDHEGFCFSVGSACRETWSEALTKAVLEAVQGRHYARYLRSQLGAQPSPNMPRTFAEHAAYYTYLPQELSRTPLEGAPVEAADAPAETTDSMSTYAAQLGDERPILFRLMTPPGIAERHPGWCVLRVEVPGLQPLHGHHAFPFLGGDLWRDRPLSDWATMPPHPMA